MTMWERIRKFLTAPRFDGDEAKTFSARTLNALLLIVFCAGGLYLTAVVLRGISEGIIFDVSVLLMMAALVALKILLQMGQVQAAGLIFSIIWWVLFTALASVFNGLHDTAITGYFFLIVMASMLTHRRAFFAIAGLSGLSILGMYVGEQIGWIAPAIQPHSLASDLVLLLLLLGVSAALLRAAIQQLSQALAEKQNTAQNLARTTADLQASRAEYSRQTRELERRARYLEATAVVARDIAAEFNADMLLKRVVNLISDQFDFYHTGIFLIDPAREFAVLRAASSEGGNRMLARNHQLRVGEEGIVGYVAKHGVSRVAMDTGAEAIYFDNRDLPHTRSECALPLKLRDEIIGVLDVQSTESAAFSQEDVAVLQTLADQIAVAIQTARIFQQAQESMEAERRAYGELSAKEWREVLLANPTQGYQYAAGKVTPISSNQIVGQNGRLPELNLPIKIGGIAIGAIKAHKASADLPWSEPEIAMMETLAEQLSVALESARLYQNTQLQAAREQMSSEITSRIRETLDIETILKTATREIRQALDLPEVTIQMGNPSSAPKSRS